MVSASALGTAFLTFEGIFFGLMMAFAIIAPADFAAGVLELSKEDLVLPDDKLATYCAIDNDNQHGFVVFASIIAIHAGLFARHSDRLPVFLAFIAAHGIVVWNQTKALSGAYYIGNLHEPAVSVLFGPARILHSIFLFGHIGLAITLMIGGSGGMESTSKLREKE